MAIDVGPRKPSPEVQERAGTLEPKVMHRPPNPWPSRLLWLAGTVLAVVVGLAVFPPGFPEDWVVDAGAAFEDVESWVIENDDTYWLFVYVINPLRTFTNDAFDVIVDVLVQAHVAGRDHDVRLDRRTRRRLADGRADGRRVRPDGRARPVGGEPGDPRPRRDDGARSPDHRHPARDLGGTEPDRREDPAPDPGRDADDPRVLVPAAARPDLQHRDDARPDRRDHLRAAPGGPADRPRAPRRPAEHARGRRCVRLDAMAAAVPGAPAAREALDHARREPDDHDGARHGRDRGRGGVRRARSRGLQRAAASGRRRCAQRGHRDRHPGDRPRSRVVRVEPARHAGLEGAADRRCAALAPPARRPRHRRDGRSGS